MRNFDIGGMTCSACSARVQKVVSSLDAVEKCSVNLLTNSMQIEGTCPDEIIIEAVKKAGYTASVKGQKIINNKEKDNTKNPLFTPLISSLVFLAFLMYISMGHIMWGWYLPDSISNNPMTLGLIELLLSLTILIINKRFFVSGFKAFINKSPNMDTLVALGSGTAFVYSIYNIFSMSASILKGDIQGAFHLLHNLYFESAAMILALITVGKLLEAYSKGKTTNAINDLINLAPKKASLIKDGTETLVDASSLKIGDIIAVRPGESFAADGIVIEGEGSVDESNLTGESIPVDKTKGDSVSTATVNKFGFLKVRVTGVGEDTTLSKIIKMVGDASASKAPIAKIADKVSGIFVPVVIAIAVLTSIIWLVLGYDAYFSLSRGISVLVISCPCALGLATPVAIMVASGKGAKNGILFKNAVALETLGKVKTVVFDKTGTLTKGQCQVTDIICIDALDETELLTYAYSLELKSEHPLSHAITNEAQKRGIQSFDITDFKVIAGNGLSGIYNGKALYGGSFKYIQNKCGNIKEDVFRLNNKISSQGKTPMYFLVDDKLYGIIAVADAVKDESAQAVNLLHSMGIKTVMLTGDNELTANQIASKLGINTVIASVLPDGKSQSINSLKKNGTVAMVGDGINDAPALTAADIGISVAHGTDIAMEASQVVLMKDNLLDVPAAITLSRYCLRNIKQNLFWAFIYNIIGIPLAAGAFISLFGWQLTPMFGALAMSLSSFCVVSNALRLNTFKIYKSTQKNKHRKEADIVQKTINIEGMMCPHCEKRVKEILEEIDGVSSAVTSHEHGTALLTLTKDVSDEIIEKAITDAGYKLK